MDYGIVLLPFAAFLLGLLVGGGLILLLFRERRHLSEQFRSLASEILEEKGDRFSERSRDGLGQLLDPLRQKLGEYQHHLHESQLREVRDRAALAEQVRQLTQLNQTLSQDAQNLTRALKGSSKVQGNFGELILDQVLEASGLRKGEHYRTQVSMVSGTGSRLQPDVIIDLPAERHLVVDSKVSLTAYEQFLSAESEPQKQAALKQHLDSIRAHVRGLGEKDYPGLFGLKSLDFVLMFVAVEPAFMLAVTNDRELFQEAWSRNVLLVSPSTLLFVVRTVAHLWRQEAQDRNVAEIAKRGAELYDKLVGFVEELDEVGKRLTQAQTSFTTARSKLATGRGNVIRQAEMLRELGVKPTKALSKGILEESR